jgi:hypothetical protein
VVRLISSLLLLFCLAACQRSAQNNPEVVRPGVIDHLTKAGLNVSAMDIKVVSVQFNGEQADANIEMTVKGQSGGTPMPFRYHMEHQNNKWVVVGAAKDTGHGGGAVDPNAGGANPHGGAMPPAGGGGMPSPQDLPPVKKK